MSELEKVVAEVAATRAAWLANVERRDDLIRELMPTMGATALAKITGLTRDRIYQITQHRR